MRIGHNSIERFGGQKPYLEHKYANGKIKHNYDTFDEWMRREPRPPTNWISKQIGLSVPSTRQHIRLWDKENNMAGTQAGGIAARDSNYKNNGKDFYHVIGAKGGRNGKTGGFYGQVERAAAAGSRGGKLSKRNHKFLREDDDYYYYLYTIDNEEVRYPKNGENIPEAS